MCIIACDFHLKSRVDPKPMIPSSDLLLTPCLFMIANMVEFEPLVQCCWSNGSCTETVWYCITGQLHILFLRPTLLHCSVGGSLYLSVRHFCFTRVASTLGKKPYNTSPQASCCRQSSFPQFSLCPKQLDVRIRSVCHTCTMRMYRSLPRQREMRCPIGLQGKDTRAHVVDNRLEAGHVDSKIQNYAKSDAQRL